MIDHLTLYAITTCLFAPVVPTLWYFRAFTTAKLVIFLFSLDIALTIEAAFYSDIVFIALLHVVVIPALFGLLYVDLVRQHNTDFRCFVCGQSIQDKDNLRVIKRVVDGEEQNVIVHSACIDLNDRQRKAFSENVFKKGIPK
jgi:hypothetical protein